MECFETIEEGYRTKLVIKQRDNETWTIVLANPVTGLATFSLTNQQMKELKEFVNKI